jgi:hypothetical protein
MSISENILVLVRDGLSTAEIAPRLGVRYQHAKNVLKANGALILQCLCPESAASPTVRC